MQDHTSGKVAPQSRSGPSKYLTDLEELLQFLQGWSKIGYPRSQLQVISLVQIIMEGMVGREDVCVTSG